MASRRQWEGTYRVPGKSSKAATWRLMRKRQNRCAIAFGLEARGEELGLSLKVTLFLSLGTSIGATEVLQSGVMPLRGGSDSILEIYSKNYAEKIDFCLDFRKNSNKTTFGLQNGTHFSGDLALPVGWRFRRPVRDSKEAPGRTMRKRRNGRAISFS